MVVGGTALFGGGRGGAAQSKAMVEFRAGKMTTQAGKQLYFSSRKYFYAFNLTYLKSSCYYNNSSLLHQALIWYPPTSEKVSFKSNKVKTN